MFYGHDCFNLRGDLKKVEFLCCCSLKRWFSLWQFSFSIENSDFDQWNEDFLALFIILINK